MQPVRSAVMFGAAIGLAGAIASLTPYGHSLEEEFGLAWLFALRGPVAGPEQAVVVSIDRQTIDWLRDLPPDFGRWPERLRRCLPDEAAAARLRSARQLADLPRLLHACIVARLADAGATAIAMDLAFLYRRHPEDDRALVEAVARVGRVVLLQPIERVTIRDNADRSAAGGRSFDLLASPFGPLADAAAALAPFPLPQETARVSRFWVRKNSVSGAATLPVAAFQIHLLPALEAFASAIPAGADPPTAATDRASVARHVERLLGAPDHDPRFLELPPRRAAELAHLRAALTGPEERYLNFYGPPGTVRTLTYRDLLDDGAVPDALLARKAAFVGVSDLSNADRTDRFQTVFRRADAVDLSGVEIAASAFANLADGRLLRPLTPLAAASVAFGFGAAVGAVAVLLPGPAGLAAALTAGAAYFGAAQSAFARENLWLPLVLPLLLQLPLALALGRVLQHARTLRWVRTYVPHSLVRHLLRDGEALSEQRPITVMFTDIADFSRMAEDADAAALADFLNRHFALLGACVAAEGGTVDKYIGDSLMAFWGAPDRQPDHARRACRAALRIAEAMRRDNRTRAAAGLPPIRLRIGVHSGRATVGNIGGGGHSNYTVVGDTVNLAQRLEQLCKRVCAAGGEVSILVSAATARGLGADIAVTPAGRHRVAGHAQEIEVFQLAPEAMRTPAL